MTRTFAVKVWLGGSGLVTGLLGMALTQRWLVWVAVTLLGTAFTVRFAERKVHGP